MSYAVESLDSQRYEKRVDTRLGSSTIIAFNNNTFFPEQYRNERAYQSMRVTFSTAEFPETLKFSKPHL